MRIHKAVSRCITVDTLSLAQSVWEQIDTPRSLALWLCIKYNDHKAVLTLKDVFADHYDCPVAFFKDYQASKLLSKSVELKTGIDKESAAYKKFTDAESVCSETNAYFRSISNGSLKMLPHVERVFQRARDIIADILGDVPSFERLDFAFGPGACFGTRGDTSVYKKVTSSLECTYAMASILGDFLSEFPGWISAHKADVQLVRGSELTFVPKDASVDRAICIEPLLNGMMQKGIGSYIRQRLKRYGVDLNDQSINQRLAQKAYTSGLSTIDLSSASDTISYLLVMEILPFDWFQLLDASRCPNYLYEGSWFKFQKFSSMGNAYTFELETLIFYALACATCREVGISYSTQGNLHVYGDDIIVPRDAFDLLVEVLSVCGFSTNKLKSYKDGSFYESCGSDFFRGFPVRPIFFKERIGRRPIRVFYAINFLRRFQSKLEQLYHAGVGPQRDSAHCSVVRGLDALHGRMVDRLPKAYRVFGPEGFGDGHLISEFDEAAPRRCGKHPSWEGWTFRSYVERPVKVRLNDVPTGYALYFNRSTISEEQRSEYLESTLRDDVSRYLLSSKVSEPLSRGSDYEVRGRTMTSVARVFCASSWRGWRTWYDSDGTTGSVHQDASLS